VNALGALARLQLRTRGRQQAARLLATVLFLRINGYTLELTDEEAFDLTMSVASGQLDAGGIQERLRLAQAPN
jgi:prophage maintenance system killer protein